MRRGQEHPIEVDRVMRNLLVRTLEISLSSDNKKTRKPVGGSWLELSTRAPMTYCYSLKFDFLSAVVESFMQGEGSGLIKLTLFFNTLSAYF